MREMKNPRDLPGFKKKSFAMYFGGGEIWLEHLDGIYEYEDLVIEKFLNDAKTFCRPSMTSHLCFNLDETTITASMMSIIGDTLTNADKKFTRICFVGVDPSSKRVFKKLLANQGFAFTFINDFEKAKEWVVMEGI